MLVVVLVVVLVAAAAAVSAYPSEASYVGVASWPVNDLAPSPTGKGGRNNIQVRTTKGTYDNSNDHDNYSDDDYLRHDDYDDDDNDDDDNDDNHDDK